MKTLAVCVEGVLALFALGAVAAIFSEDYTRLIVAYMLFRVIEISNKLDKANAR